MHDGVPSHAYLFDMEIELKSMHWCTFAWGALQLLSAAAEATQSDATNAAANVPAAQYDSAFKTYRPAFDEAVSPDGAWRAANDAVAAKPGEANMTGMRMGGSMSMPMAGKDGMPPSADKTMMMPDGTTMPMHKKKEMPKPEGHRSIAGTDRSRNHDGTNH